MSNFPKNSNTTETGIILFPTKVRMASFAPPQTQEATERIIIGHACGRIYSGKSINRYKGSLMLGLPQKFCSWARIGSVVDAVSCHGWWS